MWSPASKAFRTKNHQRHISYLETPGAPTVGVMLPADRKPAEAFVRATIPGMASETVAAAMDGMVAKTKGASP